MGDCFRYNTYVYVLYLRHEYTILAILCMGLPLGGEWLNSIIFHGYIKCITVDGWKSFILRPIICIYHMTIIQFGQKILEVPNYILTASCSVI